MTRHTRILTAFIAMTLINCATHGAEQIGAPTTTAPQPDVAQTVEMQNIDAAPQNTHYEHPDTNMPFISINTDTPLDMNWAAALEFSDPALRPMPVTLPFLSDYPFENLEIKLRVLNLKF